MKLSFLNWSNRDTNSKVVIRLPNLKSDRLPKVPVSYLLWVLYLLCICTNKPSMSRCDRLTSGANHLTPPMVNGGQHCSLVNHGVG